MREHSHDGDEHGHDHAHKHAYNHEHDLGVTGVLLHVIGDAINNIGVIIAAIVIWKAKFEARYYADPSVSMGIAFMVLLSCLPLSKSLKLPCNKRLTTDIDIVKRSGIILMGSVPGNIDLDDVKHDLETVFSSPRSRSLRVCQLMIRPADPRNPIRPRAAHLASKPTKDCGLGARCDVGGDNFQLQR